MFKKQKSQHRCPKTQTANQKQPKKIPMAIIWNIGNASSWIADNVAATVSRPLRTGKTITTTISLHSWNLHVHVFIAVQFGLWLRLLFAVQVECAQNHLAILVGDSHKILSFGSYLPFENPHTSLGYLMASNLNIRISNIRRWRPELESLPNFGLLFTYWFPQNNCFQANNYKQLLIVIHLFVITLWIVVFRIVLV